MTRLAVALLTLALLAAPLGAEAQSAGRVFRIAYLSLAFGSTPRSEALREGLRALGYVEGQTIAIDYRWGSGKLDQLREQAAELVRLNVHIIVTGGPSATAIAKDATRMIPIVMTGDADPVTAGFVASIARPGGNITGLSTLFPELSSKRIELLKEVVPKSSRLAVIANPKEPGAAGSLRETEAAARALGLQHQLFEVQVPGDLEGALEAAGKQRATLLTVLPDPIAQFHRARVVALVAKNRLPAIYWDRVFAEAGGLMAYGADQLDLHRRAATYVDKILKGAKPADLPVERPAKFVLVINLKTARALGLTIPPSVLAGADEIIE